MCGRFTLRRSDQITFDGLRRYARQKPRYNIAPSQNILTVVQTSQREVTFMQWGLIPSWSKEGDGFINAHVETIDQKPSFSESFQRRRCLILADGFYEFM
jgi:putative SOS response-associated peptidase YedK